MTARPASRLTACLPQRWMLAILALAFVGVLQLVGSGAAQAHSDLHHTSTHYQNADLSQPLERQAVVIAPAIGSQVIGSQDHPGCPGHEIPASSHNTPACCGTPCCAAALAAMPDFDMTLSNRIVAIARFYPQFIIADVVFGLDRPPDSRA